MSLTVLNTPIITPLLRGIALLGARLSGWKMVGEFPELKKCVLLGAPHTSNWDFMVMLMAILIWRLDVRWLGKHTLFKFPFGPVMRWLGGVPIDRTKKHNFVDQMVDHFNSSENLLLIIAPEGTRKPVKRWHTGFYYIAYKASVPIVLSYMDYKCKEAAIHSVEKPTGDIKSDLEKYNAVYLTKTGRNPANYFGYVDNNRKC